MATMEQALGGTEEPEEKKYALAVNGIVGDVHDFLREVSQSSPQLIKKPENTQANKSATIYLHRNKYMIEIELNEYGDGFTIGCFEPSDEFPSFYRFAGVIFTISTDAEEARQHFDTDNPIGDDLSYAEVLELRADLQENLLDSSRLPKVPYEPNEHGFLSPSLEYVFAQPKG